MRCLPLALLFLVLRPAAFCQASPEIPPTAVAPKPATPASLVLLTTPETATTPARPREVSPDTAAKINGTLPKFTPPAKATPANPEEQPDLRETDKPRNGIVRLPKYLVQEPKVPVLKDRELLTPQAKLNLAYKRHPGLSLGSLPFFSNDRIALAMLEEEQRLERKTEMEELYGLYRYSDPKKGAAVKRETDTTFIRHDGP